MLGTCAYQLLTERHKFIVIMYVIRIYFVHGYILCPVDVRILLQDDNLLKEEAVG